MAQDKIQLRNALIHLLQEMDEHLLQRITDYARGLMDGASEHKHDWWDSLPDDVKQDIDEGLLDIEQGNLIPMDEVMKKYTK